VRKPRRHPGLDAWLASVRPQDLYVSVLTLGEVRRGIERLRPRDPAQARVFEAWLAEVRAAFADRVLDVDLPVAEGWGRIGASDPLPTVDGLLAATALVHGLTVVTRDTAPFERVGVPWLNPWAT
jgi:predicted nucleic acid-binding protein